MFTRAGFNGRVRRICFALVSRVGGYGIAIGQLVRWPDSGEIAWVSRTQIVWPEHVRIHSRFYPDVGAGGPRSRLPQ